MLRNKEVLGLRFEISGLLVVLLATVWQGAVTDWFDRNNQNWIAYEQQIVQTATLTALREISQQLVEEDPNRRREIGQRISDVAANAYLDALKERQNRKGLQKGEASTSRSIRYALLLLGASMVVLGKWLVLKHKVETGHRPANRLEHRPPPESAA